MNTRLSISRIAAATGIALGAFVLSAIASTWTAPSCPPPGCNTEAPINVGTLSQVKLGWLGVKGLVTSDFTLATGTPVAGKVLTAVDSTGNATWQGLCAINISGDIASLTATAPNNGGLFIKQIGLLSPGVYSFSGSGTSKNNGGGGTNTVFLSSTLYPDGTLGSLPPEVVPYAASYTNSSIPDEVHYDIAQAVVYGIKRYGGSASTNWTIPQNYAVSISSPKYMYVIVAQAIASGTISASKIGSCSGVPTI